MWSKNPHLLKLLFDHEVTYGRHIIKVNCNSHGHIYTFTKRMGVFKSRAIHANVPNACQLLIFTWQRANKCANVPKVCELFNLAC